MKNEDIEKRIIKLSKIVKLMPPCSARDEKEDELYMLKKQLKKLKILKKCPFPEEGKYRTELIAIVERKNEN
jgi:hypothetical protein